MQELNQGEDYEEEDYGFEGEDGEFDEGDESTESEITTIYGIPKNIFIIGVIAIIVIIIAIVIIATRSSSEEEEDFDYEEYLESLNYSTAVDYEETEDTSYTSTSTDMTCYDENGIYLGTADSFEVDLGYIYSDSGDAIGYFSQDGTPVYDANGSVVGYYTSFVDSTATEEYDPNSDQFEVQRELRKLGYTGDEIELALANGVDVEKLKEAAQELRDEEAKESLIRMSDSASPEFQNIVQNSIFCMEYDDFPIADRDEVGINEEHSYIVNADYEKVPTYGTQLFIKCKIANGVYVFYNVTPNRWLTLPESGNIVLNIDYTLYGTDNKIMMYVTKITEIDTTKMTVNPQDSGISLQDVVNDAFSNR